MGIGLTQSADFATNIYRQRFEDEKMIWVRTIVTCSKAHGFRVESHDT